MIAVADFLFEISWEVCNKVGGIYTVVKSKVRPSVERYGSHYFLIGPYFPKKVQGEFQDKLPPENFKLAFEQLKKEGIVCHFGTWLVPGSPNTILIDFSAFAQKKDEIKKRLWEVFKIDSYGTQYFDYDEPIVWSVAAGMLIENLASEDIKIVAHCHEWLAGGALLYLKISGAKVATVFTTHATMLGRTLASQQINLYSELKSIDPEKQAYTYHVATKHQTEKACAQNATVFTTVSEITGLEAEHFFKRKPDVLTLNGLDLSKFPTFEESTIKHKLFKSKVNEFLIYYFFPYYSFDLDATLIYFICGRYEFHDKGIDILIKSLGKLNQKLKDEKSEKTVVCFFWIPGNIRGMKADILESKTFYNDVRESIIDSMEDIKNRITVSLVSQRKIAAETLFDEDTLDEVERKVLKLKRFGVPALSTHDLYNEDTEPILGAFRSCQLLNKKEDRVKVVFYPIYLTGADGMLDLNYYESMQAGHLGIFPSYYEPWGYTPLEAGALGVPAVTTDLAGFGRYIKERQKSGQTGIFVLPRFNRTDDETVTDLSNVMYNYALLSKQQRVETKIEAKNLAQTADWKSFIEFYVKAHSLAVERMYK